MTQYSCCPFSIPIAQVMNDYARKALGPASALQQVYDRIRSPTAAENALEAIRGQLRPWERIDRWNHESVIEQVIKREMAVRSQMDALAGSGWRRPDWALVGLPWQSPTLHGGISHVHEEIQRRRQIDELFQPSLITKALEAADRVSLFRLPDALEAHRTATDTLALRLVQLQQAPWWQERVHLGPFAQASAAADALRSVALSQDLETAIRAFTVSPVPSLPGLSEHRAFLDAAGLWLPRWPRFRLLSKREKRIRFRQQLGANGQPKHVRKARSLVDRYELALRFAIDWVMTKAFGEEWWVERLPLCDCRNLLGKWQKGDRGVHILDLADYAHYERIMTYPEHFAAGFVDAFPEPEALGRLVKKAGSLRARSFHVSDRSARFTEEDLRELRVTWIALEEGLVLLQPDHDVDD